MQTLRRLAQNREAARRSRLRKKAYIQQLEESRVTLIQLEQQMARARARVILSQYYFILFNSSFLFIHILIHSNFFL
nr:transcription factor TGA2.2-like [Ipomoea batatas]